MGMDQGEWVKGRASALWLLNLYGQSCPQRRACGPPLLWVMFRFCVRQTDWIDNYNSNNARPCRLTSSWSPTSNQVRNTDSDG
jgi:hypothetical protein